MPINSQDFIRLGQGRLFHLTATATIATANATNDATARSLAAAIKAALVTHFASAAAHSAADTSALPDDPMIVYSLDAFVSGLEAAFEAHRQRSGLHVCPDRANTVDDGSSAGINGTIDRTCTVLNRLKAAVNAHIANAVQST